MIRAKCSQWCEMLSESQHQPFVALPKSLIIHVSVHDGHVFTVVNESGAKSCL